MAGLVLCLEGECIFCVKSVNEIHTDLFAHSTRQTVRDRGPQPPLLPEKHLAAPKINVKE